MPVIDSVFSYRSLAADWRILLATPAGVASLTTHYFVLAIGVCLRASVSGDAADEPRYADGCEKSTTYGYCVSGDVLPGGLSRHQRTTSA